MFTYEMRPSLIAAVSVPDTAGDCPRSWPGWTVVDGLLLSRRILRSGLPVDHGVGERLELVAAQVSVQAGAGAAGVVERQLTRDLERSGLGDPDQRPVERAARER